MWNFDTVTSPMSQLTRAGGLCWDSGQVNSHLGSLFNHLGVSPHFLPGFRNTETGRWVIKLIRFLCRVMIRYQVQTLRGSKHQSLLPTTGTCTTDSEERRAVDCVCAHFHAHLDAQNHAVPNKTAEVVKIALPTVKRSAQPINWHCV